MDAASTTPGEDGKSCPNTVKSFILPVLKTHASTGGCGGLFTDASGIIMSPGYPNAYGDNESCIYTISQPNGTYVRLTLLSIDIANFTDFYYDYDTVDGIKCGYDLLEIRDGEFVRSPPLELLCGDEDDMSLPMTIMSTENTVTVRWVNNSSS